MMLIVLPVARSAMIVAAIVAGTNFFMPAIDMTEAGWDAVMNLDLKGLFFLSQAVARQMIKQGAGGKIVNISSRLGKMGAKAAAAYSASKFGILGLTHSLALELAPHKINVNAVCPGATVTWSTEGTKLYKAVKEIATGTEEVVALENMALRAPSTFFRRTIWQITNNIRAGSDTSKNT
jgi:NAD(P)-dependent dehydrogenase (short-subunit alcohol dehydrogenase family)